MANQTSKDFADLLVAASVGALGGTADWGIFLNTEPSDSEASPNVITLYDLVAEQSTYGTQIGSREIHHPRVQVRVRSVDQTDGWNKQEAIKTALSHKGPFTAGGLSYADIILKTPPYYLKRTKEKQYIWISIYKGVRSTS